MERNYLKGFSRAVASLALLIAATGAGAATVTLSNVTDGNNSPEFFDPAAISQSGANGEIIDFGIVDFMADGSSPTSYAAVDSMMMTITAPTGMVITSVAYTESGVGTTTNGIASASGFIVADGILNNFLTQVFPVSASSAWTIGPTMTPIDNKSSIDINVTNSLFAFALAGGATATIEKTGASVVVGLAAIPIPPAIWMMGAAITALVTVGRRGRQAS